jgi:hypothetical protein
MDTLKLDDLKDLAGFNGPTCISVYLPTHPVGPAVQQDAICLADLLQRAEDDLVRRGWRRPEAIDLLAAARSLPLDETYWKHRGRGLAVLVAPGRLRAYRLPVAVDPALSIHTRFCIKPLLAAVDRQEWFFLLTLSQNRVRLLKVTRGAIEECKVANLPGAMREALDYVSADRGEQVHSAAHGALGKQAAVFHGQGGKPDAMKSDLSNFFQIVDRSVAPLLLDKRAPLLLAGVNYLLPIFRGVCSYSCVSERDLAGNCDHQSDAQLHAQAWEIMTEWFDRPRRRALARVGELLGAGRASVQAAEVVSAAISGKVETLLADPRREQWGRYDPQTAKAVAFDDRRPDGEDLVNLAIAEACHRGSEVFPVDSASLPGRAPLAAVYRY